VARDEAFCFYYEDNLDALRQAGAEIVFFSPLHDAALPESPAGVYLGGGYPELYAAQLAANRNIRFAIAEAAGQGMPVYAECGGLMALTQYLVDLDGQRHEMIGLLPGYAQMVDRLTMGYREVEALQDLPVMDKGNVARGHEFHYSDWIVEEEIGDAYAYAIKPRAGITQTVQKEGYAKGNILASYVHLHFESNPEIANRFVLGCNYWANAAS
jgi:cobyrinic acid a,c-diamide synthase